MNAAIAKSPLTPPRWLMHIVVNNFVDQDTFLLATQQKYVLEAEAQVYRNHLLQQKEHNSAVSSTSTSTSQRADSSTTSSSEVAVMNMTSSQVRKSLYVYRSPTERLAARLGQFWDHTLHRAPHRVHTLLQCYSSQMYQSLDRSVVLDRYRQHTAICPDSMQAVKNCQKLQGLSWILSLLVVGMKVLCTRSTSSIIPSSASAVSVTAAGSVVSVVHTYGWKLLQGIHRVNTLLKPEWTSAVLSVAAVVIYLTEKIKREFVYKYTEAYRDRDLASMNKQWMDPA